MRRQHVKQAIVHVFRVALGPGFGVVRGGCAVLDPAQPALHRRGEARSRVPLRSPRHHHRRYVPEVMAEYDPLTLRGSATVRDLRRERIVPQCIDRHDVTAPRIVAPALQRRQVEMIAQPNIRGPFPTRIAVPGNDRLRRLAIGPAGTRSPEVASARLTQIGTHQPFRATALRRWQTDQRGHRVGEVLRH